jgi:hypothetical protein
METNMENRQWLEAVEKELVRHGLPPWRVGRMVEELRDHLLDLKADLPATEDADLATQHLGRPADVARAAWENHVAATYMGRHPVIGFVLLPIPLTLLAWFAMVVLVVGLLQFVDWLPWAEGGPMIALPVASIYLMKLVELCVCVLPPALAAAVYGVWARQTARGWKWNLIACLLIAVVAGLFQSTLQFPVEPGTGRWSLAFGAPGGRQQLLQLMVPLALSLWWACRIRRPPAVMGTMAMPE